MSTLSPTPIIDKIKKLLTLADRSNNPHEAALAAERMQALLQEHNLTLADVEAKEQSTATTQPVDAKREKKIHERSAVYKYQQTLMTVITGNNFCMHFIRRNHFRPDPKGSYRRMVDEVSVVGVYTTCHVLIGRSENVTASIIMYDYLIDTMDRMLPYTGTARRGTDARLWLDGCTETLCQRLIKQRTGKEAESKQQTPGLVRLSDLYSSEQDLNEDFRCNLEPGTTARNRREYEARQAKYDEEYRIEQEAIKADIEDLMAGGMSYGATWNLANGKRVDTKPKRVRKETPSEALRRQQAQDRRWSREDMKERREWRRRNTGSYLAGKARGHDIGLGGSIPERSTKELE